MAAGGANCRLFSDFMTDSSESFIGSHTPKLLRFLVGTVFCVMKGAARTRKDLLGDMKYDTTRESESSGQTA